MATTPQTLPAQSQTAPSWWDYEKTLPQELPDTARDALREKFFQEQEAPWVLQQGYGLEAARQQFMKETERLEKAAYPRAELVGKVAKAAFTAPLAGMVGDEEARRSQAESEQAATEAQKEAARQGISPLPYTMAGEALGQAPYWMGPMGVAGAAGEALGAGRLAQAGLNTAAGAFIQGSYDAAKAPTGNRLLEGAKGALVGAGMVGAFEGLGGLGHALIGAHEMESGAASAVEKAANGVAEGADASKVADAVLQNTDIDKTIKTQVQQAESAAKAAGVPLASTVGRVNGRVNVLVKGADGGLYNLGGATGLKPEDFGAMMGRISDHMDQGGSIESLTGDPSAMQKFQNMLEETRKKSFDLALPDKMDMPNDEVKGYAPPEPAEMFPGVMFAKGGSTRRDLLKSLASLIAKRTAVKMLPEAAGPAAGIAGTEVGSFSTTDQDLLRKIVEGSGFSLEGAAGDFVRIGFPYGPEEWGQLSSGHIVPIEKLTQALGIAEGATAPGGNLAEDYGIANSFKQLAAHPELPASWKKEASDELKEELERQMKYGPDAGNNLIPFDDAEAMKTLRAAKAVPEGLLDAAEAQNTESTVDWRRRAKIQEQAEVQKQIEQLQRPTGMELQRTHAQLGEEGEGGLMLRYAKNLETEDRGRIRGSSDLPLDEDGQAHADYLAQRIAAKGGFDEIHAADLQRHQQTADAIERTNPTAVRPPANPNLRSIALGGLEGMPHEDAIRAINDLIREAPDTPMPGVGPRSTTPGESVNAFARRILTEFQDLMDRSKAYPDRKIGAVVSSRDIGMLAAALKKGNGHIPEDFSFDPEEFVGKQENPGDVYRLAPGGQYDTMFAKEGPTRRGVLKSLASMLLVGKTAPKEAALAVKSAISETGEASVLKLLKKLSEGTDTSPTHVEGDWVHLTDDWGQEVHEVRTIESFTKFLGDLENEKSLDNMLGDSVASIGDSTPLHIKQMLINELKDSPWSISELLEERPELRDKIKELIPEADKLAEEGKVQREARRAEVEGAQLEEQLRPTGMELQRTHAQLGKEGTGGLMMRWQKGESQEEGWTLRRVNMESDADLQPGIYVTRHAETAWNAPTDADSPWLDVTGAKTKETPLYHRVSGDIPFLEEAGAKGGTVSPFPGVKPTILFGPKTERDTVFHENLHGHIGYLGMRRWLQTKLLTDSTAQQIAEFSNIKKNYEGFPLPDKLEEVYIHAASAARTGDEATLDQFAEADTDKEHLLNWLQDTTESILDKSAEIKDPSLHKRTLERRLGAVVNRVTSRLDDIDTSFQQGGVSVGYVNGKFAVTEGPDVRYFDDRSSMIDYLEKNHGEPLNAPELVDNSLIADNTPRYARDIPTPNILRAPVTTDPPSPETLPAMEGKVSGFALAGRYFRPFYSWLGDVSDKLGRPDLFQAFHQLDKDSIEMANFIRPYAQTIKETLGQYPAKRQGDFYRFFETDAEDKVKLASEFRFSQKELEDMDTLREKFFDPLYSEFDIDPMVYIQNYAPRIRSGNYDPMELNPRYTSDTSKGMDFFAEHVRTGELDPKDTNLLRVAGTYLRLGARKKFLGDSLDAAAELTDEKNSDGSYRLGLLQTSLKRHIEYMRGVPDYTTKLVNAMAGDAVIAINNGISKVNEFLPGKLQIPEMEATPGEELSKLILFSYAGELALRPALLARDAAQYLLTTLPVLGNYAWTGLRRAFPALREGVESDIYKVPQRYGALIERSDLQSMISQGGAEQTGIMENIANKALSFIQWSHNSNRIAAFWGHEAMAQDALESFLNHGDSKQLAKDSGMWFMNKAMRDQFAREAQYLTHDSDLTDISRRIAKEMVELTQWNFRRGANPGIYEYQLGRLFGQYGTWPLNYIEYARRFASATDKSEAMKALTRLVLTHGAILSVGQNMGIDLHSWVFTQPMAYGGGPALDILTSIPQSMNFETQRGAEARSEIRRAFFPGVIPGGEAMETVLNAINSNDPNLWMRLMGFTPMEGKEKLRGWHELVP